MSEHTLYERAETIRGHRFIKLKSGRLLTFWDAVSMVRAARSSFSTATSRAIKLGKPDKELGMYYLETVEMELDRMEEYVSAVRKHLAELRADQTVRERIAQLRNVTGRMPEEAEAYLRKADELERKLAAG